MRAPTHSLNPTGLPPDGLQRGDEVHEFQRVWNAVCASGHDRLAYRNAAGGGDLGADLGAGSTPPRPGLAPWDSLIEMALTEGSAAFSLELGGVEVAVGGPAPEVARADLQIRSPPCLR